jgi:hypothetical protein
MKWSYSRYEVDDSPICPDGIVFRPEATLCVRGRSGEAFLQPLIDTGADHSLFPISVAISVGAELFEHDLDAARGITGQEIPITPGRVQLQLLSDEGSFEWSAIVGFAEFATPEEECSLLGNAGCLELFHAAFDGTARTVELTPIAKLS